MKKAVICSLAVFLIVGLVMPAYGLELNLNYGETQKNIPVGYSFGNKPTKNIGYSHEVEKTIKFGNKEIITKNYVSSSLYNELVTKPEETPPSTGIPTTASRPSPEDPIVAIVEERTKCFGKILEVKVATKSGSTYKLFSPEKYVDDKGITHYKEFFFGEREILVKDNKVLETIYTEGVQSYKFAKVSLCDGEGKLVKETIIGTSEGTLWIGWYDYDFGPEFGRDYDRTNTHTKTRLGDRSLKLWATGIYDDPNKWEMSGVRHRERVKPGDIISGGAYLKYENLSNVEAFIEVKWLDEDKKELTSVPPGYVVGFGTLHKTSGSGDWEYQDLESYTPEERTAPPGAAYAEFRLVLLAPGTADIATGTVWWDDVQFTVIPAGTKDTGFEETGGGAWGRYASGPQFGINFDATDQKHSGDQSLKLCATQTTDDPNKIEMTGVRQIMQVNPGDIVSGGAWLKTESMYNAGAYIECVWLDKDRKVLTDVPEGYVPNFNTIPKCSGSGDWEYQELDSLWTVQERTAPPGAVYAEFRLVLLAPGTADTATGTVWWDDVQFTVIPGQATP